ncbi:MAG: hypothetical protein MJ071_00015 [Oscillospiraceae bacterium]|nr:hypothetical protein [Oscillospiraceae bacterium]
MDIKKELEQIMGKLSTDANFKELFQKNPTEAVRSIVGDKADKDTVAKVMEAVKSMAGKVDLSKIDMSMLSKLDLGDLQNKLGGLFGGKKD